MNFLKKVKAQRIVQDPEAEAQDYQDLAAIEEHMDNLLEKINPLLQQLNSLREKQSVIHKRMMERDKAGWPKKATGTFLKKVQAQAPNLNIFHGGLETSYKGILDTQEGFRKMDQELRKIKSPEAKPLLDEFDGLQTKVNLLVSQIKELRETIGKQIETGEGFSKGLGRGVGTRLRTGRTPGGKRA